MLVFCLILLSYYISSIKAFSDKHPDTYLSINELANKYGYPMESHEVKTQDGYILTVYRIPHGKRNMRINKKPVLLMHGLFGQAENFIINGMHNGSLAYLLADNGYDVWLGNARGNQHSRKHIKLNPDSKEFWNFSWHEIGYYDIAAKIDFILTKTGSKQIFYVGHSQGGTVFYVLTSMRPEYQDKISAAALLSPASNLSQCTWQVFRKGGSQNQELREFCEKYDIYEFPNLGNSVSSFLLELCVNSSMSDTCPLIWNEFNGGVSGEADMDMLVLAIRFIPTVSVKQVLHYFQLVRSGHFRQYDYGSDKQNLKVYGQIEPPDYPIERISVPVLIFVSRGDNIVDFRDVEDTCRRLPKCLKLIEMKNRKWAHIDFLFSVNAFKKVNVPVVNFFNEYKFG